MKQHDTPPQQQSQQRQGPRLPDVPPQYLEAINKVDHYLGEAKLSRTDHNVAAQNLQNVMRMGEEMHVALKQMASELEALKAAKPAESNAPTPPPAG